VNRPASSARSACRWPPPCAASSAIQTFDQHLIALYRDGVIEFEDALGVASNPHDLQVALRNQGLVA
jgi:Tfp pilus assembly ATPase PilU